MHIIEAMSCDLTTQAGSADTHLADASSDWFRARTTGRNSSSSSARLEPCAATRGLNVWGTHERMHSPGTHQFM